MRYMLTIALTLDQLLNAMLGGYANETISLRASYANAEGKVWGCAFCRIIELAIPDHCNLQKLSKASRLSRRHV